MPKRTIVFVGHANPEDNGVALWLCLKLVALGYQVWSDVTKILGGEDFWHDIEPIIRDGTIKYLYVLSRASNHKLGVLRELRIANATAKKEGFKEFVIPLRIDDLPHDDINIEIGRLNVIEFADLAQGLKRLLEKLQLDGVPKSAASGPDVVRQWWEREHAADSGVTDEPEVHYSNWFPVDLPKNIYRHSLMGLIGGEPSFSFPHVYQNFRLLTFASASEVAPGLQTLKVDKSEPQNTALFLNEECSTRQDHRNVVVQFLTEAWEAYALERGLRKHPMSNKNAFYFDLEALPNPKVYFTGIDGSRTHRGLMGYKTRKKAGTRRHWHFAVSARPVVHPQPLLQIRAHVLFSDDGRTIWDSEDALHTARRSQCKNWWNDDWRDRILATMAWLAGENEGLKLTLSGGSGDAVVSARPVEFLSPVTLLEPSGAPEEPLRGEQPEDEEDELVEVTEGEE